MINLYIILAVVARFHAPEYCSIKAKELNRDENIWGFWGVLFPLVAVLLLHNLSPKIIWEEKKKTKKTI